MRSRRRSPRPVEALSAFGGGHKDYKITTGRYPTTPLANRREILGPRLMRFAALNGSSPALARRDRSVIRAAALRPRAAALRPRSRLVMSASFDFARARASQHQHPFTHHRHLMWPRDLSRAPDRHSQVGGLEFHAVRQGRRGVAPCCDFWILATPAERGGLQRTTRGLYQLRPWRCWCRNVGSPRSRARSQEREACCSEPYDCLVTEASSLGSRLLMCLAA
jgi:hypothetical protein